MSKEANTFKDRAISTEITPEFITHNTDYPEARAEEIIRKAALRLERSYSVVAEVQETEMNYFGSESGYKVRVIPTQDACQNEVLRGVESIHYWVAEGWEDE